MTASDSDPRADPPTRPATDLPTLAETFGGPLGLVESSLPTGAFVIAYAISGSSTTTAAGVAVAIAVVLAVARLVRGQTARHAISGLVGVAFSAFVAAKSGKAENFFLPGLLLNAAYGSAFLVSIVVSRPLVGVALGYLDPDSKDWREDPVLRRACVLASWMWVGLFALRLVVKLPLYLSHAVVALGVANTAMGLPLFAIGLWVTYRITRRAPPVTTTA